MGEKTKIAISPPIQVGGSQFTVKQLAKIGAALETDAKVEMTPFKQLYAEVPLERTAIIDFYKEHAKGKEKFSKFIDRVSLEQLQQIAG
ncbi:hypothetical protein [Paenibacillus humicola]|uniref:hypothetical protein n=1 Tax=Paenibacillus humicola TaxID=3110540 RepID=UPI00237A318A|nr:hypothetical protein [Paenibacillus humicola]